VILSALPLVVKCPKMVDPAGLRAATFVPTRWRQAFWRSTSPASCRLSPVHLLSLWLQVLKADPVLPVHRPPRWRERIRPQIFAWASQKHDAALGERPPGPTRPGSPVPKSRKGPVLPASNCWGRLDPPLLGEDQTLLPKPLYNDPEQALALDGFLQSHRPLDRNRITSDIDRAYRMQLPIYD
jgi:hypothetical protein